MKWAALAFLWGCAPAQYSDPGPFPFEADDLTALLVGCGNASPASHLYCRFPAGSEPSGEIVVVVPPTECPESSCASVAIYGPDGAKALDETVPKGKTWVVVPWRLLVGPEPFADHQRGFWPVVVKWSWVDETGVPMQAAVEGEIRLRVHAAHYTPLSYDPSAQTWSWSVGGVSFGATDKGRTAVKP